MSQFTRVEEMDQAVGFEPQPLQDKKRIFYVVGGDSPSDDSGSTTSCPLTVGGGYLQKYSNIPSSSAVKIAFPDSPAGVSMSTLYGEVLKVNECLHSSSVSSSDVPSSSSVSAILNKFTARLSPLLTTITGRE
jgi:hypothetical protein